MSGHSKWATTHRQKAVTDKKRAAVFTKVAKIITIAAKHGGGDPASNFKLRLAIDKGKAVNMPKDNIERAIKSGTGEGSGAVIEELTYEGFGPHQTAFIIHCLTDNRNRCASEIKLILSKHGGSFAGPNAVSWMFESKGVIHTTKLTDEQELTLIDAGALDIQPSDKNSIVFTLPNDLQKTKEALEKIGLAVESAEVEDIAKEAKPLTDEQKADVIALCEALDDSEDVDGFATNAEL
jgi:YebC/PmpR family DNA-binding regulatory protein